MHVRGIQGELEIKLQVKGKKKKTQENTAHKLIYAH